MWRQHDQGNRVLLEGHDKNGTMEAVPCSFVWVTSSSPQTPAPPAQVRFWALPVQSLLYSAFIVVLNAVGQCVDWRTAWQTSAGLGSLMFCCCLAHDCRCRWLFAAGRQAQGRAGLRMEAR